QEGRDWLAALRDASAPAAVRAKLLVGSAWIAWTRGVDTPEARAWAEEALELYRQIDDRHGIADALHVLGFVLWQGGDAEAASARLLESLALRQELKDKRGIAELL